MVVRSLGHGENNGIGE